MKEIHYTASIILLFITVLIREVQFRTILKRDNCYIKKINKIWSEIKTIEKDIKNILLNIPKTGG